MSSDKPQVIFLLGGPGSGKRLEKKKSNYIGKGTVSGTLQKELGWIPISAGDCLREEKNRFLLFYIKLIL